MTATTTAPVFGADSSVQARIEVGRSQFAWLMRSWFKRHDVPQKITDDWANDPGIQHQTGPWASQVCGAIKGQGYSPRVGFFVGLEHFNEYLARDKDDVYRFAVTDQTTRRRLRGMEPLVLKHGGPLTAVDFWAIYSGSVIVDTTKPGSLVVLH